ncbi:MAG: bifunctional riboflavin kinase/FAD synthetase [Candidatus Poribacteria bacterium]|nr:bifunctional riboflavin kinase/FAD synthetase [Candidatus Poribacteria bacterium]
MQIFYNLEDLSTLRQELIVTVGVFDGLHIGHQAVLRQVLTQAEALKLPGLVLAFHPSPLAFLAPERCPPALTSLSQKIEILQQLGVDIVVFARFDGMLQQMSPDTFVQQVLLQRLHAKQVVVGYDWHFGKGRSGTAEILKQLGERHQLGVTIVGPTQLHGIPVHSTRIREAIGNGDLNLAAQLLGRRYAITGEVVKGEGRGHKIGFPTANINAGEQMLPPNGVYAIRAKLEGQMFDGVLNMGTRPTFDGVKFQIESHLFDFSGLAYGKEIETFFIERIRDEQAFPNPEALVNQIKQDVANAKAMLSRAKN